MLTSILHLFLTGDWAANELMKEDDDGKILTLFRLETTDKVCGLSYDEMLPFLRFLDKYARKVVNGDEMRRWRGQNMDKTLLHKLTPADVAYATLTYETKSAVWTEDLVNKRDGSAIQDAVQRYHKPKGARVKKYQDGWTDEGREYYKVLKAQYKRLWDDKSVHATLTSHWRKYESENHESSFKRKASEVDKGDSGDEGIDESEDEIDLSDEDESQSNDDPSFGNSSDLGCEHFEESLV